MSQIPPLPPLQGESEGQDVPQINLGHVANQQEDTLSVPKSHWNKIMERLDKLEKAEKRNPTDDAMLKVLQSLEKIQIQNQPEVDPIRGFRAMSMEDLDPEDVLEKPVVFFSYGHQTMIVDDYVNGRVISTPYKRLIKFRNTYRTMVPSLGGSKNMQAVSLCTASVFSKKEAEWLRKSSYFGVSIFEEASQALNKENFELADLIANQKAYVQKLPPSELMVRCREAGVTIDTKDVSELRRRLARALGERNYDNQQKGAAIVGGIQLMASAGNTGPVQATNSERNSSVY